MKQIRDGLEAWAAGHTREIEEAYASLPDSLPSLAGTDDRFQDIAEPLVVLASLADAEKAHGCGVLDTLVAGLMRVAVGENVLR